MKKSRHPIQPLVEDADGVLRFKKNAIVSYLIDNGRISLNDLAQLEFSREDREQFAQLTRASGIPRSYVLDVR